MSGPSQHLATWRCSCGADTLYEPGRPSHRVIHCVQCLRGWNTETGERVTWPPLGPLSDEELTRLRELALAERDNPPPSPFDWLNSCLRLLATLDAERARREAAEAVCQEMWRNRSLTTNARGHTSDLGRLLYAWHAVARPAPVAGEEQSSGEKHLTGDVIQRGTRVRIPRGTTVWGTFPGSPKVAKRTHVVTAFDSTPHGYERYGTPYVTWVGEHGYWHHAAITDVEVLRSGMGHPEPVAGEVEG